MSVQLARLLTHSLAIMGMRMELNTLSMLGKQQTSDLYSQPNPLLVPHCHPQQELKSHLALCKATQLDSQ